MKYTASKFSVGGYSDAYSKGWDACFGKRQPKKAAKAVEPHVRITASMSASGTVTLSVRDVPAGKGKADAGR